MNEADIAEVLEELQEELPTQEFIRVFRLLPKDIAADVFAHLPVEIEQYIINSLTDKETTNIIETCLLMMLPIDGRNAGECCKKNFGIGFG